MGAGNQQNSREVSCHSHSDSRNPLVEPQMLSLISNTLDNVCEAWEALQKSLLHRDICQQQCCSDSDVCCQWPKGSTLLDLKAQESHNCDVPYSSPNLLSRRNRTHSKAIRCFKKQAKANNLSFASLSFASISSANQELAGRTSSVAEQDQPRLSKVRASESLSATSGSDDEAMLDGDCVPTIGQLVSHPVALIRYVPKEAAMFVAGAASGALAKTVTAPLDRVKLMMQVRGVQKTADSKVLGLVEAVVRIGREEGIGGYWKGNLPQVIRVIPYSAVQLFAYETYKRIFKGNRKELSVPARLAAGACAGMTSTMVTYPLDVLRLRLAVDPACKSMTQVAVSMLREEGIGSFYRGLGPSLLGIAPYIAINFCAFDLLKKALPEDLKKNANASFLPALLSATLATLSCYPLDTVRRQLQMKGTPFTTVLDAVPGIVARDGVGGLYRGFVANALKNLPNSSIRLGTYDAAKSLIALSDSTYQRLVEERKAELRANRTRQKNLQQPNLSSHSDAVEQLEKDDEDPKEGENNGSGGKR